MRINEIKDLFAMTLILLLASAIGGMGLNADPIWGDELSSVAHMGAFNPPHSPQQVLQSIRENAPDHVPLFYLLGAGWSRLAGWSQLALRYLSLLAGLAMLAWFYRYARDAVDKRTALVAAFLMANNAFVVFYFHELRGYTLLLLLIVMHLWLYWRILRACRQSLFLYMAFALSSAAMLYTHVLGLFMLAALAASHLLVERWSNRTGALLLAWLAGSGLFLPYLNTMLSSAMTWGATKNATSATQLIEPLVALLANGLGVLLIPLAFNLAYQMRRKKQSFILRLLLLSIILVAILILASWILDLIALNRMRYFLVLWAPCILLIAYSLAALTNSNGILIIIAALWAVAGIHFGQSGRIQEYATVGKRTWQFPPLHDYAVFLREKVRANDFVLGFAGSLEVNENRSNFDWGISDYYFEAQLGIDSVFLHTNLKRYRLEEDVGSILKARPLVLLAHDPSNVPLNYARTLATVQDVFATCDLLVDEPTLLIRRYAHAVMGCEHEAAPIEYDNGLRVVDRALRFDPDAERIEALIWWDVPDAAMLDEYNISLQIISSEGKNVRQTDRHLYDNVAPWSVIDLSTEQLPADDYALVLILYRRDSESKVVGVDQSTDEFGAILPLLGFTKRLEDSN